MPETPSEQPDRRRFLRSASAAVLGGTAAGVIPVAGCASEPTSEESGAAVRPPSPELDPGTVVLFQGDSITDAGRDRDATAPNSARGLGPGYAFLAASRLLRDHPGADIQCYNRGISGNKVFQLADRWEEDCLALEPDVLSILIGVNDYWHTLSGNYDGTVQTYETDFRALLERTLESLPEVELIIGEPYALTAGSAVDESWYPPFSDYQATARAIADGFDAAFVPYQSVFEEASSGSVSADYWSGDGVHPSTAGSALMAEAWLRTLASVTA